MGSGEMSNILMVIMEYVTTSIGYWFMFKKSKIKPWYAFIPVVKDYNLAMSGDCEDEASAYVLSVFVYELFNILIWGLDSFERIATLPGYITVILFYVVGIVLFIYRIRIFLGLCEVYGRKKKWVIPWVLFNGITALIWGLSNKFVTSYTLAAGDESEENSISKVEALGEGLTIDIRKRTSRKGFTTKTLLKDINLAIEPGKMVLLLGGSGAGKTTFINAVTGYEQADATILLNGQDIYKHFNKMKYEVGLVPQQDLIRQNDSVYRTLMDAAMLRLPSSVSSKERHKRVEEVMKLFGLTSIKNNIVAKQSGGQKKRISIAMEYISDPTLFILDEPDSGLDGILARELMERLHAISREGKIVLVITHTPDRVIDLFDQVIVLAKDENQSGRLVFFGDIDKAKEFFEKDRMEDIVKTVNRPDEGGEGKTDELLKKYMEARNDKK